MPAAEQRARARALNGGRGSSGIQKQLLKMERKSWEDVEDLAEHVADLGAVVNQGSMTGAGTFTISMACPIEYAHDAMDAAIAGRAGALFIRVYVVTPDALFRDDADDGDDAGVE